MLLCARPHVKEVDFDIARFIVATASGLNVNGQHLVMGDEVPKGKLSVEALQQIYEPPLRLIETIEYARENPGLVEACTRQGTDLDLPEQDANFVQGMHELEEILCDPDVIASHMCDECGEMYEDLTKHTKKECKRNQKRSKK